MMNSWLRRTMAMALLLSAGILAISPAAYSKRRVATPTPTLTPTATPTPEAKTWNFDSDKAHQVASGWTAAEGSWEVLADPTAPSAPNTYGLGPGRFLKSLINVLNYYPVTVLTEPTEYEDFTYEASFKTTGGRLDCSGGLVFRFVNPKNYYVMEAQCPNDFLAISRITDGVDNMIKQAVVPIDRDTWYQLKVVVKGDHFSGYLGDKLLVDVNDSKIKKGRVGLWAHADSQPRYDNVKLTLPLPESTGAGSAGGLAMPPGMPTEPGSEPLPSLPK